MQKKLSGSCVEHFELVLMGRGFINYRKPTNLTPVSIFDQQVHWKRLLPGTTAEIAKSASSSMTAADIAYVCDVGKALLGEGCH